MITLEHIQTSARNKDFASAEADLIVFLSELFSFNIKKVEIRQDNLSLNSVNGIIYLAKPDKKTGDDTLFFKFHHEEKEDEIKEYYNGQLLADNDYPIDIPVYASHEVGKQVLIYRVQYARRFFDVCKELDVGFNTAIMPLVIKAQENLDSLCCERYIATLHMAEPRKLLDEPILQLFARRLSDDISTQKDSLGGRYTLFYDNKPCVLPGGITLNFNELGALKWCINGLDYPVSLIGNFQQSLKVLAPDGDYPAVIAHGDAHNGNVWYHDTENPYLSLFDPAFAGRDIPALLAEIKPTFHNIFAHPLWLYDAKEADSELEISCNIKEDTIIVQHNYRLGELRTAFLSSKAKNLWKPLLQALKKRDILPENWQQYMRLALFCCPTLVMNLRANAGTAQNSHTPKTSLLGFAIAIMLAQAPEKGEDMVSAFFNELI